MKILNHRPPRELWRAPPPSSANRIHAWLTDRASLTARIGARCDTLTVRLLRQRVCVPYRDEAVLAGLRAGQLAWVREVVLEADGKPVVYARSVVSRASVRGAWAMVVGIGARPLGAALFADPRVVRGPLAARRLDARDRRYHRAVSALPEHDKASAPTWLWARRSRFMRAGASLIVCEVFLPAVLSLPDPLLEKQ